ncbi:UbiA family prenyltransferase [Methanomethylovorans sp.]|uniref:UbiA family prenyltransferase n=1 Tax=Methanomethylovorans sp. TaxID=2758717 RepID=UPI00345EA5C3
MFNYVSDNKNNINNKVSIDLEKILMPLWKEFIFGGHLFALGAACVVAMCSLLFDLPIGLDLLVVVYLIFYPIYLYDYTQGVTDDLLTNSARARYLSGSKKTYIVVGGSFAALTMLFTHFSNSMTMFLGFIILVLGLLYSSYFKQLTKKIIGFKNFFVSSVWALLVLFFFYYYSIPITNAALIIAGFVFTRMIAIQILFDVRDIEGDRKNGLLTIPVVLGNHKGFELLKGLNFASIVLLVISVYFGLLPFISLSFVPIMFYASNYIKRVRGSMNNYVYYLLAALEPIIWFGTVFFGSNLSQLMVLV